MAQLIDTIIDGTLEVTEDIIANASIYIEDSELEEIYTSLEAI